MKIPGLERKHFLAVGAFAAGILCVAGVMTLLQPSGAGSLLQRFQGKPGLEESGNTIPTEPEQENREEMQTLRMHLQDKPDHIPILFRMAQLSLEMGKPLEAADHLKSIFRQEPDNADAHLELGRVYYELNDIEGAIRETKQVLQKNPQHVDALYNLGAIYANLNDPSQARQYWTQAVASDPLSESGQSAKRGLQALGPPITPLTPGMRIPDFTNEGSVRRRPC